MGVYYRVHVGSPTGTQRALHIPNFDSDKTMDGTFTNIVSATQQYPDIFDQTYTLFCLPAYQANGEYLQTQGFTDVVILPSSSEPNVYWYFSDDKRLVLLYYAVQYQIYSNGTWTTEFNANTFGGVGWNRCIFSLYTLSQEGNNENSALLTLGARNAQNFTCGLLTGTSFPEKSVIYDYFNTVEPVTPSTDPYNNSGSESNSGGGSGEGLDSVSGSDVSDPDLPELSAVSTGLISIFAPTLSQLQSLGNFLWSDAFSLDSFKKIFSDPWDAILGLSILGVGVSGGTSSVVNIGNISTGVSMPKLSSQYFKFNCGSISLKETWGSYLDYNPYTKISIYLPFIGTHTLNVDEIMDKNISLKYSIDILSGACIANIKCGGTVLYSFTGSCAATIPLSGNSYTNMINGIIGAATSIGSMVATGGATAPFAVPSMASSTINAFKTDVSHSGNVTGMSGIMGVKSAYLIMEVPRICIPSNQNKYIGYPTYVTKKVSTLSGYCVFEDIKIRGNSHATTGEIDEIVNIMKSGVYL